MSNFPLWICITYFFCSYCFFSKILWRSSIVFENTIWNFPLWICIMEMFKCKSCHFLNHALYSSCVRLWLPRYILYIYNVFPYGQNWNLWTRFICCFYITNLVQSPMVFINYRFMNTIWERYVMMSEVKRHVPSQLVRPLLHVQFLDVRLINDMSMTSICIIMIKLKK